MGSYVSIATDPSSSESKRRLSAMGKNGVELLVRVRVTVRTNLDQLIGGATEETIVARVRQGIVSTVGSMDSHEEALASPNLISREVVKKGIQENTAYEIVSIDVAAIEMLHSHLASIGVGQTVEEFVI